MFTNINSTFKLSVLLVGCFFTKAPNHYRCRNYDQRLTLLLVIFAIISDYNVCLNKEKCRYKLLLLYILIKSIYLKTYLYCWFIMLLIYLKSTEAVKTVIYIMSPI